SSAVRSYQSVPLPASLSVSAVTRGTLGIVEIVRAPAPPALLHQAQHVARRLRRPRRGLARLLLGRARGTGPGPQLRDQAGLRNPDGHPEVAVSRRAAEPVELPRRAGGLLVGRPVRRPVPVDGTGRGGQRAVA